MTSKKGYLKVLARNYFLFKKSSFSAFAFLLLEPLFYLLAFGLGLGSFITNVEGVSYIDYFFPGLLCATAVLIPFFETALLQFSKPSRKKLYSLWLMTPISRKDIIIGEILWATTKGSIATLAVILVATPFGLVQSWLIIPCFFILMIISFLFASLGAVIVSFAESEFSIFCSPSTLILPLILISGVLYSIDTLALPLKVMTYLLPLSHGTEAVRGLLRGTVSMMFLFHLVYLLVAASVLFRMAIQRLEKNLTV